MLDRVEQTRLFGSLADPTRLRVVEQLAQRSEMNVSDLATITGVSQPTISRHLAILRKAGLVDVRKDGLWRWYSIKTDVVAETHRWACGILTGSSTHDASLVPVSNCPSCRETG